VVGIQVMQTVSVVREESVGPVDAFGEAYLVGAGVAGVGLLCSAFVRSSRRGRGRDEGAPQGALVGDPEPGPGR
jgi:hypothetical protein